MHTCLTLKRLTAIGMACLFSGLTANAQVPPTAPPQAQPCPADVAKGSQCVTGTDTAGATYWLVMPPAWNGTLVVHAHGGPELGTPKRERAAEDATRWAIWSRAGYAYAGSGFRQGGVAVRSAAEDTERVRTRPTAEETKRLDALRLRLTEMSSDAVPATPLPPRTVPVDPVRRP